MTTSRERLEAMRAGERPPFVAQRQTVQFDAEGNPGNQSVQYGPEREPYEPLAGAKLARRSTLVDAEGKVIQAWQIEKPEDADREALWEAIVESLCARIPPADPIPAPRAEQLADLLACYPVGDHHLGMLSWSKETGASYDLEIGEELLARATDQLIGMLPHCGQSLIAVLGDFLHYDSLEPVTPTARNQLDADGRYPKMVGVALDVVCRMIERAAEHHGSVHVIIEIGNHDLSSSIFLARALDKIYRADPRITVDTSPAHFHYFEFGKTLIGTHHGHEVKMEGLPLVMANDRPEAWGRCPYRYWWTGHVHTSQTQMAVANKDFKGVSVESFRILPPSDAWAANKGYRPIRDMEAIVIHREYGETRRCKVNPMMFANPPTEERIAA